MKTRRSLLLKAAAVLFILSSLCLASCETNWGINDAPIPAKPQETYYSVTFDGNGGSTTESVKVKSGEKVAKPANPVRSDSDGEYEFIGWFYGDEKWNFDNAVTSDMTLTAQWKKSKYSEEV